MRSFKKFIVNNSLSKNDGFALVVVPILFVMFGLFAAAVARDSKPNTYYFETSTQQTMDTVRKSLAAYAHRNYRVPCPADPKAGGADLGKETGVGSDQRCTEMVGILPFRELGLSEHEARDEWGYYYTYKISPDFTRKIDMSIVDSSGDVPVGVNNGDGFLHEMCRTASWTSEQYIGEDGSVKGAAGEFFNRNIYKANFCCPSSVSGSAPPPILDFTEHKDQINDDDARTFVHDDTGTTLGIERPDLVDAEFAAEVAAARTHMFETRCAASPTIHACQNRHIWDTFMNPIRGPGFYNNRRLYYGDKGGVGVDSSGLFFGAAPTLEYDSTKARPKKVELEVSDINAYNENNPIQVRIDIVDDADVAVDQINVLIYTPSGADIYDETGGLDPINNIGKLVVDLNDYEHKLTTRLAALGLTMNDVHMKKLKFTPFDASLVFRKVNVTSDMSADEDVLIAKNEDDQNFFADGRDDETAYGKSDNTHSSTSKVSKGNEAVAYALISHGADGEGSYLPKESFAAGFIQQVDNINDDSENQKERKNHDPAMALNEVHYARKIVSDDLSKKFDDIVMFDSQITLYNSLRNGSCESAQAL